MVERGFLCGGLCKIGLGLATFVSASAVLSLGRGRAETTFERRLGLRWVRRGILSDVGQAFCDSLG